MKKTTQLSQLLHTPQANFLCEAHNALSAKIVEESGFSGIWASGFTLSAAMGVRDNNELSWTQVLDAVEFMVDASQIPILVDGDSGFGNFNNVRRFVKKLSQRGVAGVCIEDKIFPKSNSFAPLSSVELVSIEEFSGKIKAANDNKLDDDFVVVARTEALIAGHGIAEALERCEAYAEAGADAILIHSKKDTPEEIETFLSEWEQRLPVVIVPTTYAITTEKQYFSGLGVNLVIWANQLLRASILSMKNIANIIQSEVPFEHIENRIVDLDEVFRLQNFSELKSAEKKYFLNKLDDLDKERQDSTSSSIDPNSH